MSFSIEIVSVPDRGEVVAEVWWEDAMVAEIHHATSGEICLDIYSNKSNFPWSFDLQSWLDVLMEAKKKLG